MNALKYLVLTRTKNSIKELKKHPSKLITYIFFIVLIGFVFLTSNSDMSGFELRPKEEFRAILVAIYFMTFMLSVLNGLSSGGTFFTMPDVNLLFISPISPKKILSYGILKQIGTSAMVGLMLIFQYGWMHNMYGVKPLDMVFVVLGFAAMMFLSNLTAIVVYSLSSNNDRLRTAVRWVLYAVCAVAALYIVLPMFLDPENFLNIGLERVRQPFITLLPVGGWIGGAVANLAMGRIPSAVIGLVLTVLYAVIMLLFLNKTSTDYYEDVLQASEKTTAAITAKKEGKMSSDDINPKNVKLGKTGINRGKGANVFLYKHLLENRRGQIFILDKMSLLFAVITVGFAFFTKEIGVAPVFAFSVYMMIFSVGFGRWAKELMLPYVYMIPQPAFKKLIMICSQSILQMFIESALIFIASSFFLKVLPIEIIMCIIARTSMGILLLAINILIERLVGSQINKSLLILIYFIFAVLLMLPGILLGFGLSLLITANVTVTVMLGIIISNMAISLLIAYLCRNILNYAELNNV